MNNTAISLKKPSGSPLDRQVISALMANPALAGKLGMPADFGSSSGSASAALRGSFRLTDEEFLTLMAQAFGSAGAIALLAEMGHDELYEPLRSRVSSAVDAMDPPPHVSPMIAVYAKLCLKDVDLKALLEEMREKPELADNDERFDM